MFFGKQIVASSEPSTNWLVDVLKTENLQLKQGLVNIQSNLAESVAVNAENIQNCGQIEDNCSQLSAESESIRSDMGEFSHAVSDMRELAEETDKQLLGIRKFVELIEDVAAKTNLLALNATIEAAERCAVREESVQSVISLWRLLHVTWRDANSAPFRQHHFLNFTRTFVASV